MAAENTLLFGASAIRCSSQFHLQNPDLLKEWWMSWPCYCFFPLSHLFSFLFFSVPLKIEALSMLGSKADSAPPLLTVSNHFKVWCWLRPEPLWHLASVQRFASGATICDLQMTWAMPCLWQWRWFCKAKSVMCDMMWLGLIRLVKALFSVKKTKIITLFFWCCVFLQYLGLEIFAFNVLIYLCSIYCVWKFLCMVYLLDDGRLFI